MSTNFAETDDLVQLFGWPDYLVFAAMLGISAVIGVYYAWVGSKNNNPAEFLMASRSMGVFPMAMSLIASFMSAITLLGTPAEMYQFGSMYWLIALSFFFVMPASAYLYLPIFYKLQVTSAYEYLGLRFNSAARTIGSATFTVQMCLYMAVVVYAPALALSQVTGLNVYLSVTSIFVVCIFYTAVGGMKAVMWTDTIQVIIMYGSMLAVVLQGAVDVGFNKVWELNLNSTRIEFLDFDPNPATRHSVWSLIVGGYFTWMAIYGVNQSQVQRYLTVPTLKIAQTAVWINLFGLVSLISICCYGGLVIYATYSNCDPLGANLVSKPDQLFPLFVMHTLGHIPGLPGLFVAGIFSGALSTVSSGLNSLAAISLEDFVKTFCLKNMSDARATNVSKGLAVAFGVVCFGLVFVAEQLGNVLEAALSIFGIIGGPLLGVFTLGMFFPWANGIGAVAGILSSLSFLLWIGIGTQAAKAKGFLSVARKPLTIIGCKILNETSAAINEVRTHAVPIAATTLPVEEPLALYKLSYMWYSAVGCVTVIVVGLIVSAFTGFQDPRKLNPDLICNLGDTLYRFLPKNMREFLRFNVGDEYEPPVDKEKGEKENGEDNQAFASPDTPDLEYNGKKNYDVTKV